MYPQKINSRSVTSGDLSGGSTTLQLHPTTQKLFSFSSSNRCIEAGLCTLLFEYLNCLFVQFLRAKFSSVSICGGPFMVHIKMRQVFELRRNVSNLSHCACTNYRRSLVFLPFSCALWPRKCNTLKTEPILWHFRCT